MNTRIQEIRERLEKTTPGPWYQEPSPASSCYRIWNDFRDKTYTTLAESYTEPDAYFIAHSRQDIPYLLDYIEKMEKALAQSTADAEAFDTAAEKYGYLPKNRVHVTPEYYMNWMGIEV